MNYIIGVLKDRDFVDANGLEEVLAPVHELLRKLEKRVLTLEAVITGKAGVSSKKEDEAPRERSVRARERGEEKTREERPREEKIRRPKAKDLLNSFE